MKQILMDNFSILLDSFKCDRNCPYCISKNDKRFTFSGSEDFTQLKDIFEDLRTEKIHFRKVMILGNGEPALYSYEELKILVNLIVEYKDLFDCIRLYTSGRVFVLDDIFTLFNNTAKDLIETEFVPLIVSFDSITDQKVLGHKDSYINSHNFKSAVNIKLDIALTDYLDLNNLINDIKNFVDNNSNIKKIKFRILRPGKNLDSPQSAWVLKHGFDEEAISHVKELIANSFPLIDGKYKYKNASIGFGKERTPKRFLVWSKNKLMDFNENEIVVKDIRRLQIEENLGIYNS